MVFSYSMKQQWKVSWLDCNVRRKVDFIWQRQPAQWLELRWSSKALPKAKQNKGDGRWWPAASLNHHNFLNPGETTISEKLSKSMRYTETATSAANTDQQQGPNLLHDSAWPHVAQPMLQKLKWIGIQSFLFIHHIHLTSRQRGLPLLGASWWLSRENASTTGSEPENAFQEFVNFQTTDFYATEIKLIFSQQNVLIAMALFWLIKMYLNLVIMI